MKYKILFFLVGLFAVSTFGFSQNNYWSQQFGSRSSLMGGAVVGGVQDNSALYYNPAGIAYIDSNYLNVSANAYGMDWVNLKNGAGTNVDLNSLRILIYPQFISGLIKFKFIPKLKMAYGLLTRYRSDQKMHADNTIDHYQVIPGVPADQQHYYGSYDYELNSISQWGGFDIAYKFTPTFAMGLTTFITYTHSDGFRNTFLTTDVNAPNPDSSYTAKFSSFERYSIDHFGMLWKLGFQFSWEKLKLGFAVTTPNISLFGFTRIAQTIEYQNQDRFIADTQPIGRYSSWLISADVNNLSTTLRNPLSLSVGLDYLFPKTGTRLAFTGEVFLGIPDYLVARSPDSVYIRPTSQYTNVTYKLPFMQLINRNAPIINVAIGLEQKLSPRTTLFLGIRTDFNNGGFTGSNKKIISNTLNHTYNHYLHFSAGVTFKKGGSDISFGLNYGLGATSLKPQLINLSEPQVIVNDDGQYLALQGVQNESISANVHSFALIIGYTHRVKRH
jgi:hypothetical protein